MPQPITKPLIASSNFLEFSYEIVTSTYYHASLCFMTTVHWVLALCAFWDSGKVAYCEIVVSETDTTGHKIDKY